jgi:hypothetical protein
LLAFDGQAHHFVGDEFGDYHQVGVGDEKLIRVLEIRPEGGKEQPSPELALQLDLRRAATSLVERSEVRQIDLRCRRVRTEPSQNLLRRGSYGVARGEHRL